MCSKALFFKSNVTYVLIIFWLILFPSQIQIVKIKAEIRNIGNRF